MTDLYLVPCSDEAILIQEDEVDEFTAFANKRFIWQILYGDG